MHKIKTALVSLITAIICFYVINKVFAFILGVLVVEYGYDLENTAKVGGSIGFVIWILVLWGIRKIVVSRKKSK